MVNVTILSDAGVEERSVEAGTTFLDLFASNKEIVLVKKQDQLFDLATEIKDGDEVTLVMADSSMLLMSRKAP